MAIRAVGVRDAAGLALALLAIGAGASPAIAAPLKHLNCGDEVTQSMRLANDVGPCADDGLVIVASNVTLDLDGHSVTGTFDPLVPMTPPIDDGIALSGVHGVTVTGGAVTGFSTGILIDGGYGNRVTRMHVHDNRGRPSAGDGITVFGSDRNRVDHNRVIHNGPASGITLLAEEEIGSHGSSFNEVSDNVVLDNNIPEIDPDGTPSWRRDIGIAIEGPGATHNRILRNRIENSGTHGIQVFPDCSTGYDIGTGCPQTTPNDYNVIRNNTSNRNGTSEPQDGFPVGDGISLLTMGGPAVRKPGHTIVEGNTTNANQRNGISLGGGNGQELGTGAWTTGGESYGCHHMENGDPDDPIVDSPDLCGVSDNTVTHNTAVGNGSAGIWVGARSDRNTISYNDTRDNARGGVVIGLAVRYDGDQNEVRDATGALVTIPGSGGADNVLEHNNGAGNGMWDGADENPACGSNVWQFNRFAVVNQACVG